MCTFFVCWEQQEATNQIVQSRHSLLNQIRRYLYLIYLKKLNECLTLWTENNGNKEWLQIWKKRELLEVKREQRTDGINRKQLLIARY